MGRKVSQKNDGLLKATDLDGVFSVFKNDKERLKYMKMNYGNMDIADAFSKFYGLEKVVDKNKSTNFETVHVEVGGCYYGTVTNFDKNGIEFQIPGVKEEITSKENLTDVEDAIRNYLLTHDNKLYFEVRSHERGKFNVSVINGYYNLWKDQIDNFAKENKPITVHIDSLTKGGYLCHTAIDTISNLTGKQYTHSVFIPGSNIVLNIENDFEKWVGQDVKIIPQKFVKYQNVGDLEETSLIGSRKKALQIIGSENIHEIYMNDQLLRKNASYTPAIYSGKVTGIINSNKKCGIFIELDDMYITGLVPLTPQTLLDYKPGDSVRVQVAEFETKDGKENFVYNKAGKMIWCNTRLIFQLF